MISKKLEVRLLYAFLVLTCLIGCAVHLKFIVPRIDVWHDYLILPNVRRHTNHFYFTAAWLAVALFLRTKTIACIGKLVDWRRTASFGRPRMIFIAALLISFFVYHTKANIGFYNMGIFGWTYKGLKKVTEYPESPTMEVSTEIPIFIGSAIRQDAAKYLWKEGYLQGRVFFLHYSDGTILPFNLELVHFVFPGQIFGRDFKRESLFFKTVQYGIRDYRRGFQFLLPLPIAYWNHTPRMGLSYKGAPSSDQLEKISFYDVELRVTADRRFEVTSAELWKEIHAPK